MLRLVVASLFPAAAIAVSPDVLLRGSATTQLVKLVHVLCFATSWGATVWAVFISGIIMFFNLPRHMMGNLRGKVFPACFALTGASSAVSAAAFAWLHHPLRERRQLAVLVATAGFDLANLLVFTPKTLEMMKERHKLERSLGHGIGIAGSFDGMRSNARAASRCPALAALNSRFWTAHALSSLATLSSATGLAVHLFYLAGKLAM